MITVVIAFGRPCSAFTDRTLALKEACSELLAYHLFPIDTDNAMIRAYNAGKWAEAWAAAESAGLNCASFAPMVELVDIPLDSSNFLDE